MQRDNLYRLSFLKSGFSTYLEELVGIKRYFWGFAPSPSYFFALMPKSNQKRSRLQIILGLLLFALPTQYNSLSLKQYCLQQATSARRKPFAYPKIL
jgi:hypothetical protein